MAVLGELGAPHVDRAHAADLLQRGRGKRALLKRAHKAATDRLLDDESMELLPLGVELDPESVYIADFEPVDVMVNAAYRIGTEIAVEASVAGFVLVDVIVYKPDAYGLDDRSPIHIHDWEFNDHYAEGQAHLDLEVVLETSVNDQREISEPAFIGAHPPSNA